MRILVAEDNRSISTLLQMILEQEGHSVIMATNGLEALQQALLQRADAAILDGSMPVMDGWEVCRRIKVESTLPVMLLSVHDEPNHRALATAVGADAFMAKPFDIPEFLSTLDGLVAVTKA